MCLVGTFLGLKLRTTKMDVSSAFRLLRIRPALALVVGAEFPALHVHTDCDWVCFYLVMPCDWGGGPAHFARFGGDIAQEHFQNGLMGPPSLINHAFLSTMCTGGGIFAELDITERLRDTTRPWGYLAKGLSGSGSASEEKLTEEGTCESQHLRLASVINMDQLAITFPEPNVTGAKIPMADFFNKVGPQFITIIVTQKLLGHL